MGNSDGRKKNISKKKSLPDEANNLTVIINDLSFSGTAIHDRGIIIDVNDVFCRITGYSREELIGASGLIVIPPRHHEFVKNSIASNKNGMFLTQIIRKDGTIIDIEIQRKPIEYHGKTLSLVEFRDISLIQKINDELKETNKQFNEAQELAHTGSWSLDISTGGVTWSRESYRIWGVDPSCDPLSYEEMKNMIHPDDRDRFIKDTKESMAKGISFSHQIRIIIPDGRLRHIKGRANSLRDSQGNVIRVFGSVQDITEEIESQLALQRSEEKFRSYMEEAPDGIFITDENGVYLEVNQAACSITGFSKEELIGMNLISLIPPEYHARAASHFQNVALKGSATGDLKYLSKKGEERYWNVKAVKLSDTRFLGFVTDVTERKRAEEELKIEKERANLYLDIAEIIIIVLSKDQTITMINRKGCQILEYGADELIGKNWFDICIPKNLQEQVKQVFDKIIAGNLEPVEYFENSVITRTGQERIIAWHNTIIRDDTGSITELLSSGEDITEKRKVENELRISRERFDLAIEASNDAIWDRDLTTGATYFSPRWYTMLGYTPDQFEASYDTWKSLIHPDEISRAEEMIRDVLQKPGKEYRIEFRMKMAGGNWKWVLSRGKIVRRDDSGKPLRFIGTHTDISARKQAEEALKESEKKFRLLFENMIEGVALHELVYDTDGMPKDYRIIEVNPAFEQHTGMNATRARGALATAFYGTGEAPYLDEYADVVKSKIPFSFETYFPPQKKHFKISTFPLSATRFATVFEDITAYKTIMENLRVSQERLNLALEASSDAIWDWDLTSNTLYFSPQWFTMLGYEADEYETSYDTWKSLLHPDDVSQAEEEVRKTISSRNLPYNIEFRMKTKDNQWKWILDRGKVVEYDENGTPLRFIGTHTDLTEIKRVEEEKALVERQLFQAQKMEAIGTLAGGLAHDFNNVLGAMKGSLDIMETYLGKESLNNADKIFKYLGTAQSSSQRAADIIKDLMALSRLEKERHNPVEINLALKHILQIAKNSFPKSVNLDFQFTESPIYVMGDPTQLEQVFLNLCVNASHAMTLMRPENDREGGNLNISIDILHADDDFIRNHPAARPGETYTEITVSDSGVGINDDDKKRIFEPFFTTKDKDQGTGLGLSMVYNIVTSHEGFLGVYSEPGQGTSIKVYLPRFTADDSVLRPAEQARIFSGTGNILVIDDEENILSVAREFLTQFGYTTILAPGPLEGLDIYRRDHSGIDAVILDLSMPVMSGYDVFLELRKINPHVKVLLSSGFSHDTRVGKLLKEGATGFIAKPYSRSMLSEKIKDVLK